MIATKIFTLFTLFGGMYCVVAMLHLMATYKINPYFKLYSLLTLMTCILLMLNQTWAYFYQHNTPWPFKLFAIGVITTKVIAICMIRKISRKKELT